MNWRQMDAALEMAVTRIRGQERPRCEKVFQLISDPQRTRN